MPSSFGIVCGAATHALREGGSALLNGYRSSSIVLGEVMWEAGCAVRGTTQPGLEHLPRPNGCMGLGVLAEPIVVVDGAVLAIDLDGLPDEGFLT